VTLVPFAALVSHLGHTGALASSQTEESMEEEHRPPAPDLLPLPSSPPAPALASPQVPVNSMAELPRADGGGCLPVPAVGPCLASVEAKLSHDGGGVCLPLPATGPCLVLKEAELPHTGGGSCLPVLASTAATKVSTKSYCCSSSF
jgi:hypothetical protein